MASMVKYLYFLVSMKEHQLITTPRMFSISPSPHPLGRWYLSGEIPKNQGTGFSAFRTWPAYALVFLVDGEGIYRDANGVEVALQAGSLMLLSPHTPHQYGSAKGETWSEIYLSFQGPLFDLWWEKILSQGSPVLHLTPIPYWLERIRKVAELAEVSRSDQILHSLIQLQMLLADVVNHTRSHGAEKGSHWREEAKLLLTTGEDLPLETIARRCGFSYESFRKKFLQNEGISPGAYRRHATLERARHLLLRDKTPCKQIAALLHFQDEYHFSKSFRAHFGISPSRYRKQHLEA